jgi:hypothetical protein
MYRIDPTRLDLVRRFRADPFARHDAELQTLVTALRLAPVAGKYFLLEERGRWQLGRLGSQRYAEPALLGVWFETRADGEWEIFRRRWEERTGTFLSEP